MTPLGALSRSQSRAVHAVFPSVQPGQLLNWGEYANVYGLGDESVLKVTTCVESYRLMRALRRLPDSVCPGVFPEIYADFGQIRKGAWALRTERLQSLSTRSRERQTLKMLDDAYGQWMTHADDPTRVGTFLRLVRPYFERELRVCGLEPVWRGLRLLARYVMRHPATALDLKISNFMVRGDTGEVVITDPLFVPEWIEVDVEYDIGLELLVDPFDA